MPLILRLFFFLSFFFVKDFLKGFFVSHRTDRPTQNQEMNLMLNEKKKRKKEGEREKSIAFLINVHWKRPVCNNYPVPSLVPQHAVSFIWTEVFVISGTES